LGYDWEMFRYITDVILGEIFCEVFFVCLFYVKIFKVSASLYVHVHIIYFLLTVTSNIATHMYKYFSVWYVYSVINLSI